MHTLIIIQNRAHCDGNFFWLHRPIEVSPTVISKIHVTPCIITLQETKWGSNSKKMLYQLTCLHHPHGSSEKSKQMQHNSRKTTWFTEQRNSEEHSYETYLHNKSTYWVLASCRTERFISVPYWHMNQQHTIKTQAANTDNLASPGHTPKQNFATSPIPNFSDVNISDDTNIVTTTRRFWGFG
jgi:hypothetical protein